MITEVISQKTERLVPVDSLRGLLMVLMAVDHANYFVARAHPTGEFWGIPLPHYDTFLAFFTRLVTQPCAPGFFFLMGVSMIYFAQSRLRNGWSEKKIHRHLIIRGVLIVCLQFFLENTAWVLGPASAFKPPGGGGQVWFHFGVLFGLGATMIVGALLMRLSSSLLLILSAGLALVTQFLTPDASLAGKLFSPFLRIVFIPGKTGSLQVFYPVVPWLSFVLFGLVFGRWFLRDKSAAYRKALLFGLSFLFLFLPLRWIGRWANLHKLESLSLVDYLNVTKYPPSITFSLLTLGVVFLFLFLFSKTESRFGDRRHPLQIFGTSALFFYIAHLYVFAFLGFFFAARGGGGLGVMYAVWLLGLAFLYPLCLWYGRFKKRTSLDSIWRFF